MGIQHHSIHGSQALDLASLPATDVHVAMGCGRGARLLVPLGWISVTLVLSGVLELNSGDAPWQIFSHHLQVWLDGGLRHTNRAPAWWLCIAAPASVWDQIPRSPSVTNLLIPHEVRCDRELASTILHIARRCNFRNTANNAAIQDGMMVLRDTLVERQQTMRDYLERCSGRTAQRRHQTMLRLLRVQHLIRCNVDARLDLNHLAAVANYSPPHLIRVYRDVFDETPFEFASRLRLQRAWNMACTTRLSICEIADALGFETESAFCRAFKQSFGCTASQARRQNLDSKVASCPTSKGSTTADGQLLTVVC
ncbi:AraC family transcriptional regulator [Stenotrophomonas sp.]|uniref:AraC family transcriptional regulator n=1 Tax=Stenotrophomonas sp. TaxID=69392 RepID=UPI0028B18F41|nr:AraC family transcriptional regulator [Stenotrophomonas sp.]